MHRMHLIIKDQNLILLPMSICLHAAYYQKGKISSTTHEQLLQWLHGKQQQTYYCGKPYRGILTM